MKRLSNIIILLLLTFTANADTSIYILNNTDSDIDFNVIGLSSLINRKHIEPLQPYKQTYAAELSRYSGVKAGEVYDFYILLGESHLSLAIKLEGTIWGSNISYTFADPESL